jgi:hypothetical protein
VNLPARTTDLSEIMLDGPLKNLAQAWAIAKVLAQSTMVPKALQGSAQNCLVTMMLGQELGLTWTQATRGIYVLPNGTPGLRGQLLLAKMRERGHRYTIEHGDNSCTCTITRKDEDFKVKYTGTFNLEDAKAAGLVTQAKDGKLVARSNSGSPLPWEQYRRDMLQWRAVARAAGVGAPEVIYGFDIAGIGDGAEGAVPAAAPGPAPSPTPVASGPGQVWQAEVVDDTKRKLEDLNASMTATTVMTGGNLPEQHAKPEPEPTEPEEVRPAPGYDDLDQLLKRSGFHDQAQADLLSALIHRDVLKLTDLSKGEVLIAHDVVTRAVKGQSTTGARRAALTQLAVAERQAMEDSEAQLWQDAD